MKLVGVTVPADDVDALTDKPTGHGGTHESDAQQSDAHLLVIGLGS